MLPVGGDDLLRKYIQMPGFNGHESDEFFEREDGEEVEETESNANEMNKWGLVYI